MLLEEAGMERAEVASLVMSYPHLLTISAARARQVVHWLLNEAGFSRKCEEQPSAVKAQDGSKCCRVR